LHVENDACLAHMFTGGSRAVRPAQARPATPAPTATKLNTHLFYSRPVFENTYFTSFSDLKKHDF